MKRIIITSTLLAFAVAGFAQQGTPPKAPAAEQVAQREANSLSERLSLTEDQRSKAYSVFLDRAKKQQADREARMKEMQKQRDQEVAQSKQQDEKISQFLNEDQKRSYQQMQVQRQRPGGPNNMQMQRQGAQRGFGGRPNIRNQRLQRGGRPNLQFERGSQRLFQQRGPQRQFQQGPQSQQRGPQFQSRPRPGMRNDFGQGTGVQNQRPQFNARPQDRNLQNGPQQQRNFQNTPQRFQGRPDSLRIQNRRIPPVAPGSTQAKPADKI